MSLRVRETDPTTPEWDALVRRFENRRVTHHAPWLTTLRDAQCGTPIGLVFEQDGEPVGVLPGLLGRMGPWTIFGSPRAGWQTVSLGPAFDAARTSTGELMSAAVPHLEREHGVKHIEIMHPGLDAHAMRTLGFEGTPVFTYRAALHPGDPDRTLRQFKDSARRNINRARRLGLEVRLATGSSANADEHYAQVRDVFTRNGAAVPFSAERMKQTVRTMMAAGQCLAVETFLPGGNVCIATGTFFVEGTELSLWQWAHKDAYRWYRATELMTWTVIEHALALGCTTLDFMGSGDFKTRLGGEPDTAKVRWLRSRPRWLGAARSALGAAYHVQQHARGTAKLKAARVRETLSGRTQPALPPAVVMGDQDLVRALALGGIPATLLAPLGQAARRSRAVKDALPWIDPARAPEKLVQLLVAYGQSQPEPPVLFYEDDAGLLFVSRHRDRLKQAFRFVVPDAQLVEQLADKGRFAQLARKLKLPVAASVVIDPSLGLPDLDAAAFPAVIKPLRKASAWMELSGGRKAMVVESAADVTARWPELAELGLPLLLQQLVPGGESRIESYHVYVDERGATVAEFTGRKIRTWPLECGDSCALEISDAPDVLATGRDVVKRLKVKGLAKLDFKRAPDGTLVLLEVNARCTLWLHLAAAAGLNIPRLVYDDLRAAPRGDVATARVGATWVKPWLDVKAARAAGMPFAKWAAWALGCDAISAFAWSDPMPLLGAGFGRFASHQGAARPPASAAGLVEQKS